MTARDGGHNVSDRQAVVRKRPRIGRDSVALRALRRASELSPFTAGSSGSEGDVNSFVRSVTVTPPPWAASVSVIAIGSASGDATLGTSPAGRFSAFISIGGDDGTSMEGFVDALEVPPQAAVTAHHQRTFPATGPFEVELKCDAQGSTSLHFRSSLSVICVFGV